MSKERSVNKKYRKLRFFKAQRSVIEAKERVQDLLEDYYEFLDMDRDGFVKEEAMQSIEKTSAMVSIAEDYICKAETIMNKIANKKGW